MRLLSQLPSEAIAAVATELAPLLTNPSEAVDGALLELITRTPSGAPPTMHVLPLLLPLMGQLKQGAWRVMVRVFERIPEGSIACARRQLRGLMHHPVVYVRQSVVEVMANANELRNVLPEIALQLGDVRADVRALKGLPAMELDSVAGGILELLGHADCGVGWAALKLASRLTPNEELTQKIALLLQDPQWYVRSAAISSLGGMLGGAALRGVESVITSRTFR